MIDQYVLATNDDGDLAIRTVSATESSSVTDTTSVITATDDGKLAVRVVGAGGDSHNKGSFLTPEALRTAYPTAQPGDFAIVESTDTVWVWDSDTSNWKDGDTKGQVTSVNNQTGAVTLGINDVAPTQAGKSGYVLGTDGFVAGWVKPEIVQVSALPAASEDEVDNIYQYVGTTDANYTNGYFYECVSDGQTPATYSWTQTDVQPQAGGLPSQTGQSGKFLTTDGTDASWSDKPLVNRATGYQSLVLNINPNATSTDLGGGYNVMVGFGSKVQSTSSNYNTLIGYGAITGSGNRKENIAIGRSVTASANKSIVIGQNSTVTADYAIQLGNNGFNAALNPDANTFKVANANGNFEMMSADGTIPSDRLVHAINKYSTMPTAASTNEGWIVQFTGTTDSTYTHGYIYECKAQGTDPETYAWQQTDVQPQAGGLPSQTGQSGKFLTTDGTDASWSNNVIVSSASEGGISISSTNTDISVRRVTIGNGTAAAGRYGVAVGYNAQTGEDGVAIGNAAKANGSCSFAAGEGATTTNYGIAIGCENKTTANYAIQIGGTYKTNSAANTFKVGNQNGNFEMMSADGTIPTDRFATTPSADGTYVPTLTISSGVATRTWTAPSGGGSTALSLTLAAANWSNNTITVTATGVTASNNVIVSPAPASQSAYTTAGVMCTAQASDSLTFTCTTTPSSDLTVTILII